MEKNENIKNEEYQNLLYSMNDLTSHTLDLLYEKFFDQDKYLISLYHEAFASIQGFCLLLCNGFLLSQACTVLRMAIEEISKIRVLINYPELLEEYKEHYKFKLELTKYQISEKEKKEKIKMHYESEIKLGNDNVLKYLDYGWIYKVKKDYGFHSLVKLTDYDHDIFPWINELNKWVHGSLMLPNILEYSISYSHVLIDIAAKLLDILCCDFHNRWNFDFVIDNIEYFSLFRNSYKISQQK